jgi:hypothetical protein
MPRCCYCEKVYREEESTARYAVELFCSEDCEKFQGWEDEDNAYSHECEEDSDKP